MGDDPNYRVGRGKPPLHGRFRPGNRANPGGRPRRSKSLAAQLLTALDERTEVEGNDGKRRKIARRRLGLARLAEKFATGDPQATRIVIELVLASERGSPAEATARPASAAADKAIIANFLARLRGL